MRADQAGFHGVMAVDTFQPWLPSLGQAPFVWSLLAAVGEQMRGDLVAAMAVPGYRLHPVALAQAVATLAALHPQRVWVSLSAGEAINEHVAGGSWPEPRERIDRMFESVDLIRKLFSASVAGKDARYSGDHVAMESARLWTMPLTAPSVLVATGGPLTAYRAGRAADGLMVVGVGADRARHLMSRFVDGARSAGRDPGLLARVAHVNISWARTEDEAIRQALQRFPIGAMRFARGDLRSPHTVEQIARLVRADDLSEGFLVSVRPERIVALAEDFLGHGYQQVYLNNVGDNHAEFLDMCATQVLPHL